MEYEQIEELDRKVLLIESTTDKDYWNNPIKFLEDMKEK